ncbi:hypothetical protein [Campylobacter troglodytis]|nr:hypothetical protein [Campylobacter troglodytis]
MLKCEPCVYTQMVKYCLAKEMLPIIRDFADASNTTILGKLQSLL